jgi:large subunit ribosomal protein L25
MKRVDLVVKERQSSGSAEARRMRRSGVIPGVFYGSGNKSIPLSVESSALKKAMGHARANVIINLSFEGSDKTHAAILKEYQSDPLGRGLLHIDFMEVRMDKPIEAAVHIELTGTAAGVLEGGVMDHTMREVHVRCLPNDMPAVIEFAVDELEIGDSIKVVDLAPPANVEIIDDGEMAVASIIPPTILKEEPTEEELEEAMAEGEAVAAETEAAPEGEAGEAEAAGKQEEG